MGQKLKQFTEYFRNASLEIRTYYLVAAVGSVFSFFTMTTNIILGFGWLTVVLPLAIGLITILITYWGAKTGNFYRSAIIILTLLCVVVYPGLWLVSGGTKGTIPLFFLVSLFFIPLLLNKRDSLILFILNIIAVVGLLVLENAMPQIIQQYSNDFIRIIDMIFVMLLLLTSAFFLAMVLKLEYQRKIDSLNVLTKE